MIILILVMQLIPEVGSAMSFCCHCRFGFSGYSSDLSGLNISSSIQKTNLA